MQRWPAAPNALPRMFETVRSMTASGITTMKFFAPPSACTRLPAAAERSYTYFATLAEPTNETASMPGWSRMPLTTSTEPLTRLTTPSGSPPASSIRLKTSSCVSGTCSDGLRMNVLPQAIANGRNQKGTIAGKLNGHDRSADADRLADRLGVDGGGDVLEDAALHRLRHGRRGLDHLDRAADLGAGVGQRLAHLAGDRAGQLVLVRLHHLAEAEQPARALDRRAAAPPGERGAGGGDGGVDVGRAGERHARQHLTGRRVGDVQQRRTRRRPAPSGRRCSCRAGGSRWWSRSARRSAPWGASVLAT